LLGCHGAFEYTTIEIAIVGDHPVEQNKKRCSLVVG